MPKERKPHVDVLSTFKGLSDEADHFVSETLNQFQLSALDAWFSAVKDTIIKIKDCDSIDSITNIEYPSHIGSYLGKEYNKGKNVDAEITEIQREHVHRTVKSQVVDKTVETVNSQKSPVSVIVPETKSSHCKDKSNGNIATPAESLNAFSNCVVVLQKCTPEIRKKDPSIVILENDTCSSETLIQTPILNRTFNKTINKTLLGSFSCKKTKIIDGMCNDSATKLLCKNVSSNILKDSGSGVVTRSGTKRRSSTSKSKGSKKQKTEESSTSASRSGKSKQPVKSKSRQPLVDKNIMKTVVALSSEQHSKMCAVIVPPVQKKIVVSKEKLISEEIKKRDEKANENLKRIAAERQMKAEQNKKTREEKKARIMQKRMQLEKEKEERLQKVEAEAKKSHVKPIKENIKNTTVKTRPQELVDHQHIKTSVPGVLTSSKQNVAKNDALVQTPVQKKSIDRDCYDLTPAPNSSTYNFSDSDEEGEDGKRPPGKPIPLWAQGVQLKSALLQQFYNPINLAELFGTEIDSPDLDKVFGVKKERYHKRTSSAVWNHPPSSNQH